jgi:hypothetical protein
VYQRNPAAAGTADTQIYDILIKHARLSDQETDVALIGATIAQVGRRLPAAHARVVIEAEGYDVRSAGAGGTPCGAVAASGHGVSEGAAADLALTEAAKGEHRCVLGIRGGRIVFDRDGLSIPDVSRAGPYSNFK